MRLPRRIENAIEWLRFDLPALLGRPGQIALGAILLAGLVALLVALNPFGGGGGGETREVTIAVATDNAQRAPVGVLGYPLVATRNTTRISGADPVSDAAAAALATHPPAPGTPRLEATTVVPDDDWQAGIAASVLAGPPARIPVLVSQHGAVPDATAEALAQLDPRGGGSGDVAVYSVEGASVPSGLRSKDVEGDSPAAIADSIDQLRQQLTQQEPEHILVVSSDDPGYAMPAAAWAARSGDPVLFAGKGQVPDPTLAALRRHAGSAVYVLGPESVISKEALAQIGRVSATVTRVGAPGVVQNAVSFAGYTDGSFGWNITQTPGHGMELANADRPLDAAAAASLASSGKWGPLLVTDTADALPPALKNFLLSIKPAYETDPTQAVYNHVWLMGDATAIGGEVQAEVDELAELVPIGGATQGTANGGTAQPGTPENEPTPKQQQGKK